MSGVAHRTERLPLLFALGASAALAVHCGSGPAPSAACAADADGLRGGAYTFDLAVSDTAFTPTILKAQNVASVTLTLRNTGSRPHDFVVACLPTPNPNGCPATSCFPDASTIAPLAPDATAKATFTTPSPEGIYVFRSDLPGDTQSGQFVVQ